MDPIVSNAGIANSSPTSGAAGDQLSKPGASGFDKVRAQLQQNANALGVQLPQDLAGPQALRPPSGSSAQGTSVPPRIDAVTARTKVETNLGVSRHYIDRIQNQVKVDPSIGSLQKVSSKLTSIENQYNQLDIALRGMSQDASPTQWLRLQEMANSMNENVNVLSKLVDSASSGVKTILQTQI